MLLSNVSRALLCSSALLLAVVPSVPARTKTPSSQAGAAKKRILAPTPPMGWNSWDFYGLTINETQFRDNVQVLSGLSSYGWKYAVIDEGWFLQNPRDMETPQKLVYQIDGNGRYIPVPARFPSVLQRDSNQGFTAISAYVHSLGLKFGIHIVRGIPRKSVAEDLPIAGSHFHASDAADQTDGCPWDPTNWGVKNTPAGQAWYDSLMSQYAGWGVDYIKVDCVSDHPYRPNEIKMIHKAIVKTGRPIVLSLSPGPTSPALAHDLSPYAQMWRISDDIWDDWIKPQGVMRGVRDQFPLAATWAPFAKEDSWPDADMLPIGHLGPNPGEGKDRDTLLTKDEQVSLMTLWAISRSPLIVGANLTMLDDWTKNLITNRDLITLNQHGHDQKQVAREGNTVAWTSQTPDGRYYLAIFNLNDRPKKVTRSFSFYNLPQTTYDTRNLWSNHTVTSATGIDVILLPHACLLLQLDQK